VDRLLVLLSEFLRPALPGFFFKEGGADVDVARFFPSFPLALLTCDVGMLVAKWTNLCMGPR